MSPLVSRIAAIATCVALAVATPCAAFANSAPKATKAPPSAADKRKAKRHYSTAQRLFDVGRFREALTFYQRAFDAAPLPGFLFNIGQCHRNLKQYAEAIFSFRRYLRLKPKARNRAEVETLVRELENKKRRADAEAKRRVSLTPQPAQPKPSDSRPLYKKWWFWTGLAAVTITGTVFAVRSGDSGSGIPDSDLGNVDFDK
jgi:tetratricopeptide (TPR) repeat protein